MATPPPRLLSSLCLNASKLKFHGREAHAAVFESNVVADPSCSGPPSSKQQHRPGFSDVRKTFLLKVGYDADGKHRLDSDYLSDAIATSPLVMASSDPSHASHSRVVVLLHNPEESMFSSSSSSPDDPSARSAFLKNLHAAYRSLDKHVASGLIASYGVSSNGLSLPSSHPLHLSCRDLFVPPSSLGSSSPSSSPAPLSHLLLPHNLLETLGYRTNVGPYLSEGLPKGFARPAVIASRPLTAYPGGGAAADPHPLKLCDHVIPLSPASLKVPPQ